MPLKIPITTLIVFLSITALTDRAAAQIDDAIMQTTEIAVDSADRPGVFGRIGNYFKRSNEDRTQYKTFDFSFIGGPHYSSDVEFGLGLVAAGMYRTTREDLSLPPSNVSLFGDITTAGFWLLGIRGNTFFKGDKFRIDYTTYFYSMKSKYWGVGYDAGRFNEKTKYTRDQAQVRANFLFRAVGDLFVGLNGEFNYTKGRDFDDYTYWGDEKTNYTNAGLGAVVMYDTRDVITSPHSGWFIRLENIVYPKFVNKKGTINSLELTVDFFHRVWEGGILAYDLHHVSNSGDVPWTMLARMGGTLRMRGYYDGRYRDKNLSELQVELRQRIWKRIGATAWVGAGNVYSSYGNFDISQTLPNYGVGLRWEFKKRMNVRFDFGLGKDTSGFIFNINEAF